MFRKRLLAICVHADVLLGLFDTLKMEAMFFSETSLDLSDYTVSSQNATAVIT
jgi:hypothetical protein